MPPNDQSHHPPRSRSSRQRYIEFVQDYRHRRLDDEKEPGKSESLPAGEPTKPADKRATRRAYLRTYLRWLRPHRFAVGSVLLFAIFVAAFEMIEPLFLRFIVDRVLMNTGLDPESRLV